MLKNSNGITLVSLIITIVVMLILAGVSIAYIRGDQNAIDSAEEVKIKEERRAKKDRLVEALTKYNIGDYIGSNNIKSFLERELNCTVNEDEVTIEGETFNIEQDENDFYYVK